jgi:hypothetical protein
MTKQIKITIHDEKLWHDFKEFVEEKHGTSYIFTSVELQNVLYKHLRDNNWKEYSTSEPDNQTMDRHDQYTHRNLTPKKLQFLRDFDVKFINDNTIKNTVLKGFIRSNLGISDYRSVNNWINFLKAFGWIKEISRMSAWENKTPPDWERELGVVYE